MVEETIRWPVMVYGYIFEDYIFDDDFETLMITFGLTAV